MFKEIKKCVDDLQLNVQIKQSARQISNILNRPIGSNINIVGTNSANPGAQLYGWQSPVAMHQDNSGIIFFMPLVIEGDTEYLIYNDQKTELKIGHLYMLDDSQLHATIGNGNVISLFMGSFQQDQITDELIASVEQQFLEFLN